jgi:hypothetical protein
MVFMAEVDDNELFDGDDGRGGGEQDEYITVKSS